MENALGCQLVKGWTYAVNSIAGVGLETHFEWREDIRGLRSGQLLQNPV